MPPTKLVLLEFHFLASPTKPSAMKVRPKRNSIQISTTGAEIQGQAHQRWTALWPQMLKKIIIVTSSLQIGPKKILTCKLHNPQQKELVANDVWIGLVHRFLQCRAIQLFDFLKLCVHFALPWKCPTGRIDNTTCPQNLSLLLDNHVYDTRISSMLSKYSLQYKKLIQIESVSHFASGLNIPIDYNSKPKNSTKHIMLQSTKCLTSYPTAHQKSNT